MIQDKKPKLSGNFDFLEEENKYYQIRKTAAVDTTIKEEIPYEKYRIYTFIQEKQLVGETGIYGPPEWNRFTTDGKKGLLGRWQEMIDGLNRKNRGS